MTAPSLSPAQIAQRDALVERLLKSVGGAFDVFAVYLGDRLNYYRVLAENDALTSIELAAQTDTDERCVREWLEQQTVTGILAVEDEKAEATQRRYRLAPGHAEVLVDVDSLNYVTPLTQLFAGCVRPLDSIVEAYRTGQGVPYSDYGPDLREGQAAINRSTFLQQLAHDWIPAMPDVHARLNSGSAHIADIGCGFGWSSIGLAQGYPNAQVDGFDLDGPSIDRARLNAQAVGLGERLNFQVRDAGDPALAGQYDLVTAFECIHDVSNPVAVLQVMRHLAGERGTVLVVDERVGDTFTARGNEVEAMMYGWSILHCLLVGMVDPPAVGTGTVMRAGTLRKYALGAGFVRVEILPIENFFFQFYRLYSV